MRRAFALSRKVPRILRTAIRRAAKAAGRDAASEADYRVRASLEAHVLDALAAGRHRDDLLAELVAFDDPEQ